MAQPHEIVSTVQVQLMEWKLAHETRAPPSEPKIIQRWEPPEDGWVKINSDDAVSRYGDKGGARAVFRDHNGAFRAGLCQFLPNIIDPEMAEVLACRRAIQVAIDLHVQRAHVELDCQAVVQMLNRPKRNLSAVGPWVQDIKRMLNTLEDSKVSWVRRSGNVAVHKLARVGVGDNHSEIWVDSPSDFILDVIADGIPSFV
nr:uncharacterized protein LOC123494796 [Aegilops tauschii subsp. strangulata]